MSSIIQGTELRNLLFGNGPVSKSTGTLAASTVALFTIAGGRVAVTAMWGLVGTSITVANSYKLQMNPTTGDTKDLCVATDIGTTDTAAGTIVGFGQGTTAAPALVLGGFSLPMPFIAPVGQIESVSGGTDGEITWYCTWVPLTTGATLVAA